MSEIVVNKVRFWHQKVASFIYFFIFLIAVSGFLMGWKSIFLKNIYENNTIKASNITRNWLPLDTLEVRATRLLNDKTDNYFTKSVKIELRPETGYICFYYKRYFAIVIDGATGEAISIVQNKAGLVHDLHDGTIFETFFNLENGWFRSLYNTILGLALSLLVISGVYLLDNKAIVKKEIED